MSNLVKVDDASLPEVSVENDLSEPFLGALIPEPTSLAFTYTFLAAGLLFLPGLSMLSAIATVLLGAFDVKATLASAKTRGQDNKDDDDGEENSAPAPVPQRAIAPASSPRQEEYFQIQRPSSLPDPAGARDNQHSSAPAYANNPWADKDAELAQSVAQKATDRGDTLTLADVPRSYPADVDDGVAVIDDAKLATKDESAVEASHDTTPDECAIAHSSGHSSDLATEMSTPDADGYYRSRLLTGRTRSGKGLVTLTAAMQLKKELGDRLVLFGVDGKNDSKESHRWGIVPKENRIRFSCISPQLDEKEIVKKVWGLIGAFYNCDAEYKLLLFSELKMVMSVFGQLSKSEQGKLSTQLSNFACGGASSHMYIWLDTNVVGLKENGFNGAGDRDSFNLSYITTEKYQEQITTHASFTGTQITDQSVFTSSGRAYWSEATGKWCPVPTRYAEIDDTLKEAVSAMPTPIQKPVRVIDSEAQDLGAVCKQILVEEKALSLSLPQLAERHAGIKKMLSSDELRPALEACLSRAGILCDLRVAKVGGEYTVMRSRNLA